MITDAECADYSAACYWDTGCFDLVIDDPALQWTGIKRLRDCVVVAKRGSTTPQDWFRDFKNLALMTQDADLGGVHPGFMEALRPTRAHYPSSDLPWVFTGHSLGAGEAFLDAAEAQLAGMKVLKVCVFGPPRPGGERVKDILLPVPGTGYKNRSDPVAD